ncbi:MAG: hypothetical protein WBE58_17890, partial [Verrucomicrobiales bacterium]
WGAAMSENSREAVGKSPADWNRVLLQASGEEQDNKNDHDKGRGSAQIVIAGSETVSTSAK